MEIAKNILFRWCRLQLNKYVLTVALTIMMFSVSVLGWQPRAQAILAQGDAVTDPKAILQYSLPIDNKPVRKLQKSLEDISNQLRGKRWKNIGKDLKLSLIHI